MTAMRYFFIILFLTPLILAAQEGDAAVTGRVINKETHEPIGNCNVALEDNSLYTVTDNAGKFFLRVPYGVHEITFSFVGFATLTKKISLSPKAKSQNLIVELEPSTLLEKEIIIKNTQHLFGCSSKRANSNRRHA